MIGLWNVNWLNQNSQRAYPLSDEGDKCSELSPDVRIPDDFLLALRLSIHTGHDVRAENFFLKSLAVSNASATVTFGYAENLSQPSAECVDAAVGHLTAAPGILNCRLTGVGDFEDTVGYAAFNGECPLFNELAGLFSFAPSSTRLEVDCIVPMLRGVSSVSVDDGTAVSDRFYGDIQLEEGTNIRLETVTDTEAGVTRIIIHALDTTGFTSGDCVCDLHQEAPCIRTINGVGPDSSGNLEIRGGTCVTVSRGTNSIIIKDTCSTPECGCDELETLAAIVREMEDGEEGLNRFLEDLNRAVTSTGAAVSSSNKEVGCAVNLSSVTDVSEDEAVINNASTLQEITITEPLDGTSAVPY